MTRAFPLNQARVASCTYSLDGLQSYSLAGNMQRRNKEANKSPDSHHNINHVHSLIWQQWALDPCRLLDVITKEGLWLSCALWLKACSCIITPLESAQYALPRSACKAYWCDRRVLEAFEFWGLSNTAATPKADNVSLLIVGRMVFADLGSSRAFHVEGFTGDLISNRTLC